LGRKWKHGLIQPSSCCFLHLPAKKCFAMRTCQQGKLFAVSPPPVSPCSGRRAWKMPAIWSASSEVSDRPHGPWQHCLQAPSTACPPMSWPLCKWDGQRGGGQETGRRWKHFLPSFSSSCLLLLPPSSTRLLPSECPAPSLAVTSYFRVRPRLQVRLLPSDPSAEFEFTCAVWIQPARLRPSAFRPNTLPSSYRHADLYCRERSRNPVASGTLFRGCRVRKMPTDIELSRPLLLSGVDGWGSLTDRNGPWLNLHTSTRLPSEDSFCPREWAVAACVRRPVRWVFPSMRGLSTTD